MSKFIAAADPNVQIVTVGMATTSGFAASWAAATDVAMLVFGVPLPVMLASACGSFGARALLPATSYAKALGGGVLWAMIGGWGAQLAQSVIGWLMSATLPNGALAGCAIVTAAIGQWIIYPENVDRLREAVGRLLDGVGRKS